MNEKDTKTMNWFIFATGLLSICIPHFITSVALAITTYINWGWTRDRLVPDETGKKPKSWQRTVGLVCALFHTANTLVYFIIYMLS